MNSHMSMYTSTHLEPRKQPRQSRSQVTVDYVFEATIQGLLSDGHQRLTTTRVADRAGVSVGTLYQYYPNKQALLYAVLRRHLARVGDTVEAAARSVHHAPLVTMVGTVVEAFVRAKTERIDEARSLYGVASTLDSVELVKAVGKRSCVAISAMLATASDARFYDLALVSYMFHAAMVGPTRAMLEGGAPPKMLRSLRGQLESLCLGYLQREALPV
jgi:AcrR family transcriptional regulator